MADIHIDEFYHDCGKALSSLYNSFPRLTTLYIDDLISNSGTDEYGIPTRRHKSCFDALLWLAAEGYIRYQDTIRQDALDQVVLTEKSFLRLSLPEVQPLERDEPPEISALKGVALKRATHGWQLRKAVSSGSTEAINRAMISFLRK